MNYPDIGYLPVWAACLYGFTDCTYQNFSLPKKEIYEETVNTVLALVLTLPLEVLMDHYWQKSYRQRLPGFVDKVLEYYEKWQDGEIDMEDLKKDLWEFGGIKLEGATIEEENMNEN